MRLLLIDPNTLVLGGAAIFTTLVFFIIIFIFLYQKRHHKYLREKIELKNGFEQELLRTQLETQEQTFNQISEDLHDNIGQLLSSTRMLIGISERSLDVVPDALRTADQTLAQAILDLRMLSKSLNKEWLQQFNLLTNLRVEVERINMSRTVEVKLRHTTTLLPLNRQSQVMLFRVIQEALHNSFRHSEATSIEVEIDVGDHIEVSITDDGRGFLPDATPKDGLGLMSMKHRTQLLGGTIQWHALNPGVQVRIQVPIQIDEV